MPSLDGALGHRTKRTDQLGVPIRATESERPHELLWLDRLQGRDGRPWPFTRRRLGRVPAEQPAPPRPQGRRAPVRPPPHFATWLEDAGIPSRVIDELMGHEGGRIERGSAPWARCTGRSPRAAQSAPTQLAPGAPLIEAE